MRSENLSPKSRSARGSDSALLDAPANTFPLQSRGTLDSSPRRDFGEDIAGTLSDSDTKDDGFDYRRQRADYKLSFRGRILQVPRSVWGRITGAFALLILVAGFAVAAMALHGFFLHDSRFIVASSSSIQSVGNAHLSRAQLLSVFGEDVERNIFTVPLAARRAELEQLPWVAHATVMRLLPNHIRILIAERTPVAFVRQGTQTLGQIGMVDASGVLLDMPPDAPGDPHYSFPVVTGISAGDPLTTRAARMKIYAAFTSDLDSTGQHISEKLSEIDLSNPEDVRALIPEGPNDVLVHFGESDFLNRYQKFEEHLPEWRTQYPKLASVDMRYDRQVVLEMQPGVTASAPVPAPVRAPTPVSKAPAKASLKAATLLKASATLKPAAKAPAPKTSSKPLATTAPPATTSEAWHMVVVKPHTKGKAAPSIRPAAHPPQAAAQ